MKIARELQVAMIMAAVSGANIKAPEEVSKIIKEKFPLDEDAIIYMKRAASMVENRKDLMSLVVHVILDNLTVVEIMKIREVVSDLTVKILKYLDSHPDLREPGSFEEVEELLSDLKDLNE